ncbi:MAG: helix-hairpin-helix domain-containing protein [Sphingomonadaceae bacterium]
MPSSRQLCDLAGIGPAMLRDFDVLGIRSVQELSRRRPEKLYEQLVTRRGPQDICVLDAFRCAVAQAKNPRLPAAGRNWWYWSRLRKSRRV